jgi:hypothetical protein
MYYKVKINSSNAVFFVSEDDFDCIVSELLSTSQTLLIIDYLSEEKLPETYVELKVHC